MSYIPALLLNDGGGGGEGGRGGEQDKVMKRQVLVKGCRSSLNRESQRSRQAQGVLMMSRRKSCERHTAVLIQKKPKTLSTRANRVLEV